jgi:hypothetical protein
MKQHLSALRVSIFLAFTPAMLSRQLFLDGTKTIRW